MADDYHARARFGLVILIAAVTWAVPMLASARVLGEAQGQLTEKNKTVGESSSNVSLAQRAARRVEQLAQAGATQLALRIISQSQPTYKKHPASWIAWERAKLSVLASEKQPKALVQAVSSIPAAAPKEVLSSAFLLAARATVGSEPMQARYYLRQLIWAHTVPSPTLLYEYRRLVVRSYVVQDRFSDASRALKYLARSTDWNRHWRLRLLAAEVALQRRHPREAIRRLSGMKVSRARPLMLLAELHAGIRPPVKIQAMAHDLAKKELQRRHRRLAGRLHMVAAAAANQAGDEEQRLQNLFEALRLDSGDTKPFKITVIGLWHSLERVGTRLGNKEQLLFGEPHAWLLAAQQQRQGRKPMLALALLVAAAAHGTGVYRAPLLSKFAGILSEQKHGDSSLLNLFSEKQLFPDPGKLPKQVRYRLLAPALAAHRIALASVLLNGLHKPPKGVAASGWKLERARIFIMGGNVGGGVKALKSLLSQNKLEHPKSVLPVILNLESLQHYKEALSLLILMMRHRLTDKLGQQVMFWIGKAYEGLGAPGLAARAYLRSAIYLGPYQFGQWSETARYAAAGALVKVGYYADARRIYRTLYDVTSNAAEKSMIKHKLAAINVLIHKRQNGSNGSG